MIRSSFSVQGTLQFFSVALLSRPKVVEICDEQIQITMTLGLQPANERAYRKQVRSAEHGRLALCGSDNGSLICWDLLSGERLPGTLEHGQGRSDRR